jgi:hypothetical protein
MISEPSSEKVMHRVNVPIAEDIITLVAGLQARHPDLVSYTVTDIIEFAVAAFIDDFEFNQANLLSMDLEAFTEDVEGTTDDVDDDVDEAEE